MRQTYRVGRWPHHSSLWKSVHRVNFPIDTRRPPSLTIGRTGEEDVKGAAELRGTINENFILDFRLGKEPKVRTVIEIISYQLTLLLLKTPCTWQIGATQSIYVITVHLNNFCERVVFRDQIFLLFNGFFNLIIWTIISNYCTEHLRC